VSKQWKARGMTFLSCKADLEIFREGANALSQALRG
jgi:hypothetical protein